MAETRNTLADAIADCMHAIKPLMKSETNTHGSYNFASVDDFLNLTRPICAKYRLVILQDEEACEIADGQVFIRYAFTLHHGNEMAGPFRRSIAVNSKMGSQAFGAAQSYALKQFLRSLLQISTGEKDDIDFHKPEQLAEQKVSAPPPATITDEQRTELMTLMTHLGVPVGEFLKVAKLKDLRELRAEKFEGAKGWINEQAKAKRDTLAEDSEFLKGE